MSKHHCLRMAVCAVSALMLGACTAQYLITDRAVEFNKAQEALANRLLLLNAVRASKRTQMAFSEVTIVRASDPISGGLQVSVPVGGDAGSVFTFTPNFNLSSGTSFESAPLNKQEFTRGITTAIKLETFQYYLRQGWPKEMLFLVFIRHIELNDGTWAEKIDAAFRHRCKIEPDELCESGIRTELGSGPIK